MLERVSQDAVTAAWLTCLPDMEPALRRSRGNLDAASVLFALHDGTMQLWMDTSQPHLLSAVTCAVDHPGIRVLQIALLAGRGIGEWLADVEATFAAYARELGCGALECHVRPGLIGARYDRRRAVLQRWTPLWTTVRLTIA